jgi:uncharacterized protein (TIGR00369 family)
MDQNHAGKLAFGPFHDMADPDPQATPPEGYERMPTFGPFHELLGPMYVKQVERGFIVGLRVEDKHRNRGQMMHGGMVCTLADSASHWAAKHSRQPLAKMLTTGLSVNLMGNAEPGAWVEAHAEVLRAGRSVVFTNCHITCAGRVIAQASAQFQVMREAAAADSAKNT